jgi:hypothetical protein
VSFLDQSKTQTEALQKEQGGQQLTLRKTAARTAGFDR